MYAILADVGYPFYSLWLNYSQTFSLFVFFKSLSFERTYWMLFQKLQKRAIHTKLDSYILATQLYEQDT